MYTSAIFDGSEKIIGHGAQADVYLYHGFAYKAYRPDYLVEWIEFEKSQQQAVNRAGLSAVRYYDTEDPHLLKMDLVSGVELEERVLQGFVGGFDILASMFRKVHSAPSAGIDMPRYIHTVGMGMTEAEQAKVIPIVERLTSSMSECICHLDMHFKNIMIPSDGGEPVIIDWINARIAPPVFDYARTYAVFKEFAPEAVALYEKAVGADIAALGISDSDFADAVTVSTVVRECERRN